MHKDNCTKFPGDRQRGAVLVIALIMLLLLTLVGIAGMRDTQLQEKMAGGTEDRAIAFQAAEAALSEAEVLIQADNCTAAACSGAGFYTALARPSRDDNGATSGGNPVSEVEFWSKHFSADGASANYWADNTKVKTYPANPAGTVLTGVINQPRYVIEKQDNKYSPMLKTTNGGSPSGSAGTSTVHDYVITARGTGRTNSAVVILQSTYRYATTP